MIKVRVIGAGGYGGAGIIDLLLRHPQTQIVDVVARENVGQPLSARLPHLTGFCDLIITDPAQIDWSMDVDVVFTATPDGVGMTYAESCLTSGAKLIDYSGDFRFPTPKAYAEYASRIGKPTEHGVASLLTQTVYGCPELHQDAITKTRLLGNPGCFAISTILAYAPAVAAGAVENLICDAKTGVSGAGIKPHPSYHYPARYENMNAYKIGCHQHCVEVEQSLSQLTDGDNLRLTLTAQVVPLARGIMSTAYGHLTDDAMTAEDLLVLYQDFYKDAPFVRVVGPDGTASNNDVRGSNFCVLWVNIDARTRQMIVVSHIDNLLKGQAGSALQNMNLMCGLDQTMGLMNPPMFP